MNVDAVALLIGGELALVPLIDLTTLMVGEGTDDADSVPSSNEPLCEPNEDGRVAELIRIVVKRQEQEVHRGLDRQT
jgi:hypothetical protein